MKDIIFHHILRARWIEWFIGGSYRFGYHNESSDLDFFVFWNDNDERVEIPFHNYLIMNGFNPINPANMVEYPHHGTRVFKHGKYDIHVIIFENHMRWKALELNHNNIEKYLKDNPQIVSFIKEMKGKFNNEFSFKGKWIYKTLIELVKK